MWGPFFDISIPNCGKTKIKSRRHSNTFSNNSPDHTEFGDDPHMVVEIPPVANSEVGIQKLMDEDTPSTIQCVDKPYESPDSSSVGVDSSVVS